MKNGFCFKDLNFEGKAGFALSLLATSLAQQVTAADVFKSELPQHKAVTYNVDSRGSLSTSVTNKWTQSLAANTTLASTTSVAPRGKMSINDEIKRLRAENIGLRLRVDELAKEMLVLKHKSDQVEFVSSVPAFKQQLPTDVQNTAVYDLVVADVAGSDLSNDDVSGHRIPKKPLQNYKLVNRDKHPDKSCRELYRNQERDNIDIKTLDLENRDQQQQDQIFPYAHHVVYIFQNKEDQQRMWSLLADAGEDDRWQGVNTLGTRYFIYAGAFQSDDEAQKRALHITKTTGVKPVVYFEIES